MKTNANIKVGKAATSPDLPAHTKGVREGNQIGSLEKEPGFVQEGSLTTATARRSTSVGAEHRNPIDPRMPKLFPP